MGRDAGHGVLGAVGLGWDFVGEVWRCVCVLLLLLLIGILEVGELLHPGGEWATAAWTVSGIVSLSCLDNKAELELSKDEGKRAKRTWGHRWRRSWL